MPGVPRRVLQGEQGPVRPEPLARLLEECYVVGDVVQYGDEHQHGIVTVYAFQIPVRIIDSGEPGVHAEPALELLDRRP
jgi:hypothetical protein